MSQLGGLAQSLDPTALNALLQGGAPAGSPSGGSGHGIMGMVQGVVNGVAGSGAIAALVNGASSPLNQLGGLAQSLDPTALNALLQGGASAGSPSGGSGHGIMGMVQGVVNGVAGSGAIAALVSGASSPLNQLGGLAQSLDPTALNALLQGGAPAGRPPAGRATESWVWSRAWPTACSGRAPSRRWSAERARR